MHLQPRNLPRIALLDCADEVVEALSAKGYDVVVGYTGYFAEHPTMDIPSALHERDLLVVDLDPGWQPRPAREVMPPGGPGVPGIADHGREPLLRARPLEGFSHSLQRGGVILCLLEGVTPPPVAEDGSIYDGSFSWLPMMLRMFGPPTGTTSLSTTDVADDAYLQIPPDVARELPDLAQLIGSGVQEVKSLRTLVGVTPLLLNESGQAKAGFVPVHGGNVLLLPYFKRKPAALHRLIGTFLPKISPELFPVRESDWTEDDAYQMPRVVEVRERRRRLEADHAQALDELAAEEAAAVVEQRRFTDLLSAHGEDLHAVVRDALDWLGFEVTDHDASRKATGGRLEEDLHVKDGAYFALVEITSSRGNAKDKDFMDLEKYRTWRRKDPGRDDIDPADMRGLLIVNQMHREEPARRELLYASSQDMDWAEHAAETGITLVSTWQLFSLIRAVEASELSTAQARAKLQQPGLLS